MAQDGFIHLLAHDKEGGHEPQVFRMRLEKDLKQFAKAYLTFRRLGADTDVQITMSTTSHAQLDPAENALAYGLRDGDAVFFQIGSPSSSVAQSSKSQGCERTSQTKKASSQVTDAARKETPPARRGRGRATQQAVVKQELPSHAFKGALAQAPQDTKGIDLEQLAVVPRSSKPHARAKAKAQAKTRKRKSTDACKVAKKDSAIDIRPIVGKPCVQRGLMRSMTAKTGPARGWCLYAWLAERKGKSKSVRWRAVSPQRTHAYDGFRSLRESVSEGIYTHLHEGLRPQLMPKIRSRRRDLEGHVDSKSLVPVTNEAKSAPAKSPRSKQETLAPLPAPPASTPPRKRQPVASPASAPPCRKRPIRSAAKSQASSTLEPPKKKLKGLPSRTTARAPKNKVGKDSSALPNDLQTKSTQVFDPPARISRRGSALHELGRSAASQTATQVLQPAVGNDASMLSQLATQSFQPEEPREPWECECKAHLRRHPRCGTCGDLQPSVIHLNGSSMVVGRLKSCDIVMDSTVTPQMISRRHAVLNLEGETFEIQDQGAVNGMLVNRERVKSTRALRHGDVVTFGIISERPELDYIFEDRAQLFGAVSQDF